MIDAGINGKTEIYGLIGDPVSHSFSPQIHNTIAKKLGDNLAYCTFRVKPEDVGEALCGARALGICGLNVTVPHKPSVMKYLTQTDQTALEAGSANTLVFSPDGIHGYNTDIIGIINTFKAENIQLSNRSVIILGAGGSARAAAIAAAKCGCGEIYLVNRTLANAEAVAAQIRTYYGNKISVAGLSEIGSLTTADVMINTTSAGLGDAEASPLADNRCLNRISVLLDLIYTPWETRLIKDAKQKGVKCINGFSMLIYQAVAAYEIWRGRKLDGGFVTALADELSTYYRENYC